MSVTTPNVVEVTDADFEQLVIEGSKTRPVVVDLWAAWCGPCRTLGPILEKVADEREGAFLLAKLDVDANQVGNALLQAVQSQGIPTVVAFRDGAAGEHVHRRLPRAGGQRVHRPAAAHARPSWWPRRRRPRRQSGDLEAAEQGYREALEKDADEPGGGVGLGRILAERGDLDGALATRHAAPSRSRGRARALDRPGAEWSDLRRGRDAGVGEAAAAAGRWREALDGMLAR